MDGKKTAVIQSLQTGLTILEVIAKQNKPLKFTEIQQLTNMTKSNIYKYVTTLSQAGFLYRDPMSGMYMLGNKLVELGNVAQSYASIVEIADPYMKKFTEETGLTALIAVPSMEGPLIKDIWSVVYGINIGAQNGTILPLNSATGLIFYTYSDGQQMTNWVEQEMQNYSDKTKHNIIEETHKIRIQGIVYKREPLVEHISACSVPLFNFQQQLVGAITAVGYKTFIPDHFEHPIALKMLRLANGLSDNFK